MGVDIDTWVAVVKAHPATYRFEGLDGWHKSVGDAAAEDEDFMNRWMEGRAEGEADYLVDLLKALREDPEGYAKDEWLVEGYIDYLRNHYREREEQVEPEEYLDDLALIEKYDDKWERQSFCGSAQGYDDCQFEWDYLRSKDAEAHLLKNHPPVQMKSHASGCGTDMADIVFICPSCRREPQSLDDISIENGRFYCGLCGAEATVGADLDYVLAEELRAANYPEDAVRTARFLARSDLASAQSFANAMRWRYNEIDKHLLEEVYGRALKAKAFHSSLYAFFESLEIDLYPFAPEKRRELLEKAMKYEEWFETENYWPRQWASLRENKEETSVQN